MFNKHDMEEQDLLQFTLPSYTLRSNKIREVCVFSFVKTFASAKLKMERRGFTNSCH